MSAFRAQNSNTSCHVQTTPHHTKKAKNLGNLPLFNFYYGVGSVFVHASHTFELDFGHEKQTFYYATVILYIITLSVLVTIITYPHKSIFFVVNRANLQQVFYRMRLQLPVVWIKLSWDICNISSQGTVLTLWEFRIHLCSACPHYF